MNPLALLVVLSLLVSPSSSTLAKSDKKSKKTQKVKAEETDRMAASPALTATQVLSALESGALRDADNGFPGAILGYVTPWNNYGYDVAKSVHVGGAKMSHISPVWLQILPRGHEGREG